MTLLKYKHTLGAIAITGTFLLTASGAGVRVPPPPSIAVEVARACQSGDVEVVYYNIYEVRGSKRTPIEDKGYVKSQMLYTEAPGGENVRRLTPTVRVVYNDGTRKAVSSEAHLGGACE